MTVPARAVLCLFLLVSQALILANVGYAQPNLRSDIIETKTFDDTVFHKRNVASLCVTHDAQGHLAVAKDKLKQMLNEVFVNQATWSEDFARWLDVNWSGSTLDPKKKNKNYVFHRGDERVDSDEFFKEPKYSIECKSSTPPNGGTADENSSGPIGKKWIVRKAPSDIKNDTEEISKINAASLSFSKDDAAKTRTLTGEGLVGIAFSGSDAKSAPIPGVGRYWYSFVPYVYTKQFNLDPDSKSKPDISYLMPGFASNLVLYPPPSSKSFLASLAIQLDVGTIIDQEQSSQHSIATLRLGPSFAVDGAPPLLRYPIKLFGGAWIYPELVGVVREFVVHDAGNNKDLLDKSTFTSIGYDATIQLSWTDSDALLSNFVFKAGYIYRATSQGGPDVNRWSAGLTWAPFATKNVTIEAEYVSGLDENTFKDEKRWTVGLGIRY